MTSKALLWVMVPAADGVATGVPGRAAPLAAAAVNGGEQGILLVANTVLNGGGAGFPVSLLGLDDATDNVQPINLGFSNLLQGSVSRLTAFNDNTGSFDRLRSFPDNVDNLSVLTNGALVTMSRGAGFDGATFDRLRTASEANLATFSGLGVQLVAKPGQWAIQHSPAADTQATITRAAGGAGVRHVCTGIQAVLTGAGATNGIAVNLRDGASGAGTILWSGRIYNSTVLPYTSIQLTDLNIVGSQNTAMTLEFAAAPAGGAIGNVAMQGYDAS